MVNLLVGQNILFLKILLFICLLIYFISVFEEKVFYTGQFYCSGFTLDNVMAFASDALTHASGEVRRKAEDIIITLYRDVGFPVRDYLPQDNKKTRKNILYRHLLEAFDEIDGKSGWAKPVVSSFELFLYITFLNEHWKKLTNFKL